MKAKLLKDRKGPNPQFDIDAHNAAVAAGKPYDVDHSIVVPAGTDIDHPDAYQLVRMGMAVPVDDECKQRAGLADEQFKKAVAAMDKIDQGLGYEDPKPSFFPPQASDDADDDDTENDEL